MQPPDAASAIALGEGPQEHFVYFGDREGEIVPRDVTHVRFDTSVRAVQFGAFDNRMRLAAVILNDELEEIGVLAFHMSTSLHEIIIPNAVRKIEDVAFGYCFN